MVGVLCQSLGPQRGPGHASNRLTPEIAVSTLTLICLYILYPARRDASSLLPPSSPNHLNLVTLSIGSTFAVYNSHVHSLLPGNLIHYLSLVSCTRYLSRNLFFYCLALITFPPV
jgi:hypothetical protein